MDEDEAKGLLESVPHNRRTFVKNLIAGAFAVPAIVTFSEAGVTEAFAHNPHPGHHHPGPPTTATSTTLAPTTTATSTTLAPTTTATSTTLAPTTTATSTTLAPTTTATTTLAPTTTATTPAPTTTIRP